jgi:hypothetical protein
MANMLIVIYLVGWLPVSFATYAADGAWRIVKRPRTRERW